jgi:EAL domain-containing protein (putative c-di-GMP-specific phosphodiesterase class I)
VRWQHPQHGLVCPDRFVGLAEDCGAINALTGWVLRAALVQLGLWHPPRLRIHMAVNVSMENLHEPKFVRKLAAELRHTGLSPHELTLEIAASRWRAWCACACSVLACRSTISAPSTRRWPSCATRRSPS